MSGRVLHGDREVGVVLVKSRARRVTGRDSASVGRLKRGEEVDEDDVAGGPHDGVEQLQVR